MGRNVTKMSPLKIYWRVEPPMSRRRRYSAGLENVACWLTSACSRRAARGDVPRSRPGHVRLAADAQRWAVQIAMRGTMMRLIQMLLLSIPLCFRSACATEPLSRITRDAFEGSWECLHWNREIVAMMQLDRYGRGH